MNTAILNMYTFLSSTGLTRRNRFFSYSCGCVSGIREYLFNTLTRNPTLLFSGGSSLPTRASAHCVSCFSSFDVFRF